MALTGLANPDPIGGGSANKKDMNAAVVADDDSVDDEDEDAEEDDDTAVQDEVLTAAKWPKGQPLESLQIHQYRNNSPIKCKRQRTSGKSDAWQVEPSRTRTI